MFLVLFKISILLSMFFGGGFLVRESYLLRSGRRLKSIHSYRGVTPEQRPSLVRQHSILLLVAGLWLLALPVLILVFQIQLSAWTGLILSTVGIHIVGQRIIERNHGLAHS